MPLQPPELAAFVSVARLGSFTRAAEQLSLSQPALSRRIRALERALGTTLFDRLPSGARLTETGRGFLTYAESALVSLRDGHEVARSIERGEGGHVSVAFVDVLGYRDLTAVLARFRDANPRVELSLHSGTSAEVSSLVLRGEATLGLRYRADPDPNLETRIVGREVLEVVCSPRHPLAHRKTVTRAALSGETWIGYPYQPAAPDAGMTRVFRQYGISGQRVIAIHSVPLQMQLITANFGIGLLSRGTVKEALQNGSLRTLKVSGLQNAVPIALVQRKGAYLSGAAKRLSALLEQAFEA
jgi:DNA-binding transcriptional LysR family regulator